MIKVTRSKKKNKHEILSASLEPKQQAAKKSSDQKAKKIIFLIVIFCHFKFCHNRKKQILEDFFFYFAQCDHGGVSVVCTLKMLGFVEMNGRKFLSKSTAKC